MNTFLKFMDSVRAGEPIKNGQVWFVPLFGGAEALDADLLDEGISGGKTKVTEVDDQGSVGEILVEHNGNRKLLIIDGEQVKGAKQDRVFNSSFIVNPGCRVRTPVSCVEHGRWHAHGSREFSTSATTLSSSARINKLDSVTHSLHINRSFESNQTEVWDSVEKISRKSGVQSPTGSYTDVYMEMRDEIEKKLVDMKPLEGQTGVMVIHGGRFISLDLFGSPSLFARSWKKVARGVLLEKFEYVNNDYIPPLNVALDSLEALKKVKFDCTKAPGFGETLSGKADKLAIAAICDGENLYHAYAAYIM